MKTVYDFGALQFNGQEKSLADYKGKVLLIVNTASQCVFTRQFKSLEKLYQTYKNEGFEILAFPSNNFGKQEPLTGYTLETFCRINQQVSFPIFKRSHVCGEYTSPLYRYLAHKDENGRIESKPLWNFHKYLINKKGEVVDYFYPTTSPNASKVKKRVEQLLSEE
ncbi:glutathione peroxidase [Sphingobacterium faecium NBRC 15299]|jgi:glutathione peroxidase|uniref:glutathione peroxidase n=1 Tax=Sphingobacterium faecium TaxID=34087 RepID=UPI000D35C480|nr:redoxin domain-containing protein [Sphingobacterium faecium]MQP29259.1 redoxin domain-containing protein [Sphingobacterium faecium]PTX10098.1 glutathione peroxidase [Sphingobacterium faecium]UZJ64577.1 redoxin domain-containing protein [Sphingobacterium sp. KU25419]GEM65395.1 glutathione peroxidase [Sphingobacterium faecium NBRC 15299]